MNSRRAGTLGLHRQPPPAKGTICSFANKGTIEFHLLNLSAASPLSCVHCLKAFLSSCLDHCRTLGPLSHLIYHRPHRLDPHSIIHPLDRWQLLRGSLWPCSMVSKFLQIPPSQTSHLPTNRTSLYPCLPAPTSHLAPAVLCLDLPLPLHCLEAHHVGPAQTSTPGSLTPFASRLPPPLVLAPVTVYETVICFLPALPPCLAPRAEARNPSSSTEPGILMRLGKSLLRESMLFL